MNRFPSAESINTDVTSLSSYLKEIGRNRILTRREERALFDRISRGDARAYNELITSNLKFVVSVCRQFQNQGLPLTDLISEGNLGLIRAAQCFDGTHECRFISYAVWWIRQRILRALAEQSRFLTIPVAKAAAIRKLAAAEKVVSQRKSRPARPEELAEYLAIREGEVLDLLRIGQHSRSLDEPGQGGEEGLGDEGLGDGMAEGTDFAALGDSQRQGVWEALEGLREEEREVLRLHYGLGAGHPMTMEEIGILLGLSRAKVRRIRDEAMDRLRQPVRRIRMRELI
ncbi:MAG: polymerase subunit sigma [Fibrobacteres bacterium]|nr:polymerase subunit sigma [Fibrobacterota bacterium]